MSNQNLAGFISARIAHLNHVIEVYVPGDEDEAAGYADLLEGWKLELATYQVAQAGITAATKLVAINLPAVEKWRSVDAVRAQNAYKKLVENVLLQAGILTP